MKILIIMISSSDQVGGLEKHSQELASELQLMGHDVTFVSCKAHQALLSAHVDTKTIAGNHSRHNPLALLRLSATIRRDNYDVVHAQGSKAAAMLQTLSHFQPRCKFVATVHNFKSKYPDGKRFCRIIAVSHALAAAINQPNVTVVYNGIQPPDLSKATKSVTPAMKGPVWLAVGRLVSAKGFDFLIKTFEHVEGSLLIAGEGQERDRLQRLITQSNAGGRIHLLGHRTDISGLMRMADAVVISSRREGFSYVFAEAILGGKPIVSTDVPIANEFLDPEFIYSGSNPAVFGDMLNRSLPRALEQQAQARKRAHKELTIEAMVEATYNVYQQCQTSLGSMPAPKASNSDQ